MQKIYFDHSATTPTAPEVVEAMLPFLSEKYGKEIQLESVFRAKFLKMVQPDERITVQGSCSLDDKSISGKFKITKKTPDGILNISRISLSGVIE